MMMMTKRRKREIKSFAKKFAIILLTLTVSVFIIKKGYLRYYVNPYTNVTTFSYLAQTSQDLNKIIRKSLTARNRINRTSKIIYTQDIGNSLLKNNKMATEYNYVVGINIGKYRTDGTNTDAIAKIVYQAIHETKKQIPQELEKTNYFSYTPQKRYSTETNQNLLSTSIKYVLSKNPYTLKFGGIEYKLKNNEALLYNYDPIVLYTRDISYGKDYPTRLRKITIYEDYYFDVVDIKNKKTIRVNVTPAHMKYPNKKLVSGSFTGITSFKKASTSIQDSSFFDDIMKTYASSYVDPYNMTTLTKINPVDVVEKITQNGYLLQSIIPSHIVSEMISNAEKVLQDKTISIFNEYYSCLNLISEISNNKNTYTQLKTNGELAKLIKDMEQILMIAINDSSISLNQLQPLFNIQKTLQNNTDNLAQIVKDDIPTIKEYLHGLISERIPNRDKYILYSLYMDKILESAGIYHVKANLNYGISVLNNKFINNIPENEYKNVVSYNNTNIMKANLKFTNSLDATHNYLMSYNPTEIQKITLDEIKKHILQDKSNYKLRLRFGIKN